MFVKIVIDDTITLEVPDNFKDFHIVVEDGIDPASSSASYSLSESAENGGYWIDADCGVDLTGRSEDESWKSRFWVMPRAVESYGFSNLTKRPSRHP